MEGFAGVGDRWGLATVLPCARCCGSTTATSTARWDLRRARECLRAAGRPLRRAVHRCGWRTCGCGAVTSTAPAGRSPRARAEGRRGLPTILVNAGGAGSRSARSLRGGGGRGTLAAELVPSTRSWGAHGGVGRHGGAAVGSGFGDLDGASGEHRGYSAAVPTRDKPIIAERRGGRAARARAAGARTPRGSSGRRPGYGARRPDRPRIRRVVGRPARRWARRLRRGVRAGVDLDQAARRRSIPRWT